MLGLLILLLCKCVSCEFIFDPLNQSIIFYTQVFETSTFIFFPLKKKKLHHKNIPDVTNMIKLHIFFTSYFINFSSGGSQSTQ